MRFSFVLIPNSFIIILFYYLAFKLLKRNFNKSTFTLSLFYIIPATGLLFNIIFVPLSTSNVGFFIYFIAAYLLIFGMVFLVTFMINLLYVNFTIKLQILIIISYAVILFLLLIFPEGIKIIDGIPLYSWNFLIIVYLFFTFFILFPNIFLSLKLLKVFKDKILKKKLRLFISGCIGMVFIFYGLILRNTWQNSLFKLLWDVISLIVILFGFMIYYGIGQNL